MSIAILQGNQGKMNKDGDPSYVSNGDYLDAKNVRSSTSVGQTAGDHENIDGNALAFDIGSVSARSKKYRVSGIGALSGDGDGWEVTGLAPALSERFTSTQSLDPHIVEDPSSVDALYMSTGMDLWRFDGSQWTEMSGMQIDSSPSYSSARLACGPAGELACVFLKDYGSGLRYVVQEWNGLSWDVITGPQGFEAASGYSYGAYPGFSYGAYFDARIVYDNSGDLYLYAVCVHSDATQNASSPFYLNPRIPRVFKFNRSTQIFEDISGIGSTWPSGVSQSWGGSLQSWQSDLFFNIGTPKLTLSGDAILFPLCFRYMVPLGIIMNSYRIEPLIARYTISTGSWSMDMGQSGDFYFDNLVLNPSGRAQRSSASAVATYSWNNYRQWAEPCVLENSNTGETWLSYGVITSYAQNNVSLGEVYVFRKSGSTWFPEITGQNIGSLYPDFRYGGGPVRIEQDSLGTLPGGVVGDMYVASKDAQASGELSVFRYRGGGLSVIDTQGISAAAINDFGFDFIVTNAGTSRMFVCFSDYRDALSYPVQIGLPTVYEYRGGGIPETQSFGFFYSSGIQIGLIPSVASVSDFVSGLSAIFPPSKYLVGTEIVNTEQGYYIEFTIDPLSESLVPILGFDYTVSVSGLFSVTLIQEPLSIADSGSLKVIGSSCINDKLFILSTPNERLIEKGPRLTVLIYSVGPYGLTLFLDKGSSLSSYGYLYLSNSSGSTVFSGTHVFSIDFVSDPSYDIVTLNGYLPSISPANDIAVSGVVIGPGSIGVAIKNEEEKTWSYTRLLSSNEFNFSTQKQADVISEQNNRGYSLYFTDNNSSIRSFYYYGKIELDGALSYINSENGYDLGKVGPKLSLQKSYAGSEIKYAGQGIGRLKCGNYRYAIRFITREGVATNWSLQSNPFSVYGTQQDPYRISGGGPDEETGKSNIIDVSWSSIDSYDFIEFAYTRVLPGALSATGLVTNETKKSGRTKISSGQQSVRYEHTGYEIDEADYSSEELQKIPFIIKRAKNIRAIDNRLVVSNVVSGSNEDFLVDVFSGITYEIDKHPIPITGSHQPEINVLERDGPAASSTNTYTQKPLVVGEYTDPENVFKYVGYMQDETYRFYAVAEYYSGELSDAYYLFDVKFDTNQTSSDLKRAGSFTDYKLNDGYSGACLIDGANVYVPYIKVIIPQNLPYINGVSAKDVIRRIHIFRADVLNKTILANGLGVLAVGGDGGKYGYNAFVAPPASTDLWAYGANFKYYYSFPFIADVNNTTANEIQFVLNNAGYYGVNVLSSPYNGPGVIRRDIVEFYSQDHLLSTERINYTSGDRVINYGHYDNYYQSYVDDSSYLNHHQFGSFYFNVPSGQASGGTDTETIILNANAFTGPVSWLDAGGSVRFGAAGNEIFVKSTVAAWTSPSVTDKMVQNSSYVLFLDSNVTNFGINPAKNEVDFGCHMISYSRNLTPDQQYGQLSIGSAIPTGAFYDLQTNTTQLGQPTTLNQVKVFGGDTFTCKSLLKYRYTDPSDSPDGGRFCVGIEFYSQSRVNPQLRYNEFGEDPLKTNFVWPIDFNKASEPAEFQKWFNNSSGTFVANFDEKISYNESYSDKNRINVKAVYDPGIYYETKLPATIFYSDPKLQESVSDSYAYIDPTNRKDLDITLGPINHHEIFNGELVTFQDRAVVRQFFNTTAMFADASSQIILGDGGSVLSRKGATLSTYGAINKWGIVKGRSQGGNDVLYWFDAINRKVFRLGADGVVPISTRGNIDSHFANKANLVQLYDIPAHGLGLHGIWNESANEAVFTFRVRRKVANWVNGNRYSQGDVVFYNGSPEFYEWHQTGEIYVSNINSNIFVPSESLGAWTHVPHSDINYYNEFTIVYSEDKNGFTTFESPMPKIYLPYKDRYLSPRPIEPQSLLYEHGFGPPCVWYALDSSNPVSDPTALRENAYIEGVVNYNPEIVKTAEALSIDCEIVPLRVEVKSKNHSTFMGASDFVLAETMYRSPVKNDASGGESPDGDTSRVYGRWLSVKFIMEYGIRQRMRSFVAKVRERNRMYNK